MRLSYDIWIGDQKMARLELQTTSVESHAVLSPQEPLIEQFLADAGRTLFQQFAQLRSGDTHEERLRALSDL